MVKVDNITRDKAAVHVIALGYELDTYESLEEYLELCETVSQKLQSGEIVIPNLARGDAVRLKSFADSPDEWYRNERLYLAVSANKIVPLSSDIDDYGHVPEEFYWPEFPADYWLEAVTHNNLVPVRVKERCTFQPNDVKLHHLMFNDEKIKVPYAEIDDVMFVVPLKIGEAFDPCKVARQINEARHVDVVKSDYDNFFQYGPSPLTPTWEAEYKDFNTDKTVLVVIPEDVYEE